MLRGKVRNLGQGTEALFNVVFNNLLKLGGYASAAQSQRFFAVNEHRCCRRLARAWQADANVGMFALSRSVDDAAHDRHLEPFNARITGTPDGHGAAQKVINLL